MPILANFKKKILSCLVTFFAFWETLNGISEKYRELKIKKNTFSSLILDFVYV
jgi:hypothetical protein